MPVRLVGLLGSAIAFTLLAADSGLGGVLLEHASRGAIKLLRRAVQAGGLNAPRHACDPATESERAAGSESVRPLRNE